MRSGTEADRDGDGRPDLAVGAPNAKAGSREYTGAVAVFYGSASGVSAGRRTVVHQDSSGVPGTAGRNDAFDRSPVTGHRSPASADLDGDGYTEHPGNIRVNAGVRCGPPGRPSHVDRADRSGRAFPDQPAEDRCTARFNRHGLQHDRIGGVGVSGPDQWLCARHCDFVVKNGDHSVWQMPRCLLREGGQHLGFEGRVDDGPVVRAGMCEGVVIYGEPAREVDDPRGLAAGEGRQEGVDPL